jgi:GTPase SAR1 family protein
MGTLILGLFVIWVVFSGGVGYWLWLKPILKKKQISRGLNLDIFQVKVPKNFGSDDAKKEEKDMIAMMEQLYSSFSYLNNKSGGFDLFELFSVKPYISLEIVSPIEKDEILFFIGVPRAYRSVVEKQIHSFYPGAELVDVPDYNAFVKDNVNVKAAYLKLKKSPVLPIKTYMDLESDSLNSITSSLSKIEENESAVIQMLISKSSSSMSSKAKKIINLIRGGKKVEQALKEVDGSIFEQILTVFVSVINKSTKDKKSEPETPTSSTPFEEEMIKKIDSKSSKMGFRTNVRLMAVAKDSVRADSILKDLESAFSQFNSRDFNEFCIKTYDFNRLKDFLYKFIFRIFDRNESMYLNTEELTSLFHFPTAYTESPKIDWVTSKKSHPPATLPKEGIIIGKNVYRGQEVMVRMKDDDRRRHMYLIGQTGTGKTSLMKKMIEQDLREGKGIAVLDPNGDFAQEIIGMIPKERAEDLIYFNPQDIERPLGLNLLEAKSIEEKDFITQEMISIFYKLVSDPSMIGPIFEHNMRNAMFALMSDPENPGTLVEIPRLFTDEEFRKEIVSKITDPMVKAFWEKEYPASQKGQQAGDMIGYLVSKLGRFIENEMIRNVIGQSHSAFDFSDVMDNGKILICNLSKGGIGEINSALLGMLIVSKLQMAAFRRNNMPADQRRDFYVYLDEFQNFTTDSISTILSEARKYRLNMILAHQFIGQLDEKIKNAVFGNVGTMVAFRIGSEDAEFVSQKFAPYYDSQDLINIDNLNGVISLMIDGATSKAFNIQVIFADKENVQLQKALIELSRLKYGKKRDLVTQEILQRSKLG